MEHLDLQLYVSSLEYLFSHKLCDENTVDVYFLIPDLDSMCKAQLSTYVLNHV